VEANLDVAPLPLFPPPPAKHTIVISTLALVLVAIIVTILVVK
jgi:hypothetical protein